MTLQVVKNVTNYMATLALLLYLVFKSKSATQFAQILFLGKILHLKSWNAQIFAKFSLLVLRMGNFQMWNTWHGLNPINPSDRYGVKFHTGLCLSDISVYFFFGQNMSQIIWSCDNSVLLRLGLQPTVRCHVSEGGL